MGVGAVGRPVRLARRIARRGRSRRYRAPVCDDWRHLLPLVDALVAHGNAVVGDGFSQTPGGYECKMAKPLDFEVLHSLVPAAETNVHLSPGSDLVWCSHCWASLFGPLRVAEAQHDP